MDDGYMNWLKVWRAIEGEITSNPAHAKLAAFLAREDDVIEFKNRQIVVSAHEATGIAHDLVRVLENHFGLSSPQHFSENKSSASEISINFTDAGVDKALEKCPPPPPRNGALAFAR